MTSGETASGLSATERAELAELRVEVAALREGRSGGPARRPSARLWRWVACGLLFTLAALLAVGGVTARFVRSQLLDTDHYVQTVAPIASDPAVQAQVIDTATGAIIDGLDVEQATADALDGLASAAPNLPPRVADTLPSLAPAIAGQIENLVHTQVTKVVEGPKFADFWVEANRAAHRNLVTVLTGEGDTAVQTDAQGNVTLSLGPIIDQVKQALVDRGLTIATKLPQIDATFTLIQSDKIVKLQRLVRLLDNVATALPLVALALGALGVFAAPRGSRRRAIAVFGGVVAGSMVLLGLALNIGRSVYLGAIPPSAITPAAAVGVFDPIVEPLRLALRAVLVFGLAVAVAGYVTGSSRSAVAIRRGARSLSGRARGGRTPSAVERWVGRYRLPLQLGALAIGALVLVMWSYPSGATVGWIAFLTGLACVAVYLVGAPPLVERNAAEARQR